MENIDILLEKCKNDLVNNSGIPPNRLIGVIPKGYIPIGGKDLNGYCKSMRSKISEINIICNKFRKSFNSTLSLRKPKKGGKYKKIYFNQYYMPYANFIGEKI
jgi:hypothetical protein